MNEVRYVTAAQADMMRRKALGLYEHVALAPFDRMHDPNVVGIHVIEYYIVPDDDPRLTPAATEAGA